MWNQPHLNKILFDFPFTLQRFTVIWNVDSKLILNPEIQNLSLSTQTFRNALDHFILWLPVYLNSFFS